MTEIRSRHKHNRNDHNTNTSAAVLSQSQYGGSVPWNRQRLKYGIAAIFCALSLTWVLSTQDCTEVFENDPTDDLPVMYIQRSADALNHIVDVEPAAASIASLPIPRNPALWPHVALDGSPLAHVASRWWQANNPPTAGPQRL